MKLKYLLIPVFLCFMFGSCVSDSQNGQSTDSLSIDSAIKDTAKTDTTDLTDVVPDSTRTEAPVH